MGVKIKIEQFKSGAINKPVSIPNTYERLKQHPAGLDQIGMVKVPLKPSISWSSSSF